MIFGTDMAIDGVRQGDSIGFLELEGTAGSSSGSVGSSRELV